MKALIIKTSSLGDIIHAFPALQALRCHAEVDWVVEKPFAELVQAHPDVSRVLPIDTKKWRKAWFNSNTRLEIRVFLQHLRMVQYDFVFDLQGNIKSGLVALSARSPVKVGFGRQSVAEWPNLLGTNRHYNPPKELNIREDYLYLIQKTLNSFERVPEGIKLKINSEEQAKIQQILFHSALSGGIKILVCSGSNWMNKQLSPPYLKSFLQAIYHHLPARFICLWGSPEEKKLAEEINQLFPGHSLVLDKLALPVLQNLMTYLDLVIAMDSLPLHLAGTTGTPTYSIFGASLMQKYKPLGRQHEALQGSCPYGNTFEKRCKILRTCSSGLCIKSLEGSQLFHHFMKWWSTRRPQTFSIHH